MRLSERNKSPIYYALYTGTQITTDANGFYTGENPPTYGNVVKDYMVVGLNTGTALLEQFGIADSYSVKLATDDPTCPIDEASVLWLDMGDLEAYSQQTVYADGAVAIKDGKIMVKSTSSGAAVWTEVPYTHAVVRVSKSKGYITYLLKSVDVTV